ncbi:MAG TPA: GntR family transcriptional regulator [Planctomycetota bacterium]|nr:GntR family transcriptional regulator [Planctomycetota bacterium]
MSKTSIAKVARHLMYQEVSARIRQLIKDKELWEQYLAPERDLAELFGVSRETLRRGLAELEREGTVARRHGQGTLVLPRRNGRVRKAAARVLVASYSQVPGGATSAMLAGLADAAGASRWSLSFANLAIPAARQEFLAALGRREVDGLLLLSMSDRTMVEEALGAWGGPAVLVDHYFEGLPLTGIIDDSEGGARAAVEHLLALGHRRIGYVEISQRERNPWRYAGYAGALRSAGVEPDESLAVKAFGSFESGQAAGQELLARTNPPTAVLAFDDLRAWGVWRAAESRGLEVGRNFALVGFGDTAAQVGFPEELSSVRFDGRELGRLAVARLADLMAGNGQPGELVKVPTELVVRRSSRDARGPAAITANGQ